MKVFLTLRVRKSVLEELTFAKLAFNKSDILNLVNFIMVNRFLILPPILPPLILVVPLSTFSLFLFSVACMLRVSSSVI